MFKAITASAVALTATVAFAMPAQAVTTDVGGYRDWVASQGVYPSPQVVRMGKTICQAKYNGVGWNRIVRTGLQSGVSSDTISTIVVGAVYELCPRYIGSLQRWINS